VEILWTPRAFPVDGATPKIFFREDRVSELASLGLCIRFREPLRLIVRAACIQFHRSPNIQATHVADTVYRFRESIAGRTYLIEVKPVSNDRWRAYIVRLPGVPTALMPFYGTTPADAARQLCDWLTRLYARAATPATGTV
jgi:hypothetical protein